MLLNGIALVLAPLTSRGLLERYDLKWGLGGGFLILVGAGDLWASRPSSPDSNLSIADHGGAAGAGRHRLCARGLDGDGGGREHRAQPPGGHGQRDDEPCSATSVSPWGRRLSAHWRLAARRPRSRPSSPRAPPPLRKALATFNARGLARSGRRRSRRSSRPSVPAVKSCSLGANSVPATVTGPTARRTMPFNPLKDVAFHALAHSYAYWLPGQRRGSAGRRPCLRAPPCTVSRTARWSPRSPWLADGAGRPARDAAATGAGWPSGGNRPGPQDAVMYVVPHNQ